MAYPHVQGGYVTVAQADATDRMSFIRKVYGLMFLGVLVFFAAAGIPLVGAMLGNPLMEGVVALAFSMPWWLSLAMLLGVAFFASAVSRTPGLNLIAFFLIAGLYGFLSISLISFALAVGGVTILLQALGLTTFVMGGLTAYVFISRRDFSFLGGFLTIGLFLAIGAVILFGVMSMITGNDFSLMHYALSIFVCLLFAGYVLFDTSNILHHYSTDMVVPAATAIMIDFVVLFRQILFLLAASRD